MGTGERETQREGRREGSREIEGEREVCVYDFRQT